MANTRYKEYVQKMLDENKDAFDSFKIVHNAYYLDQNSNQEKFNSEGEKILEIVRVYEDRLCANQERGMYNKFSTGLSEKFKEEIRKIFPMIDHIGIKTEKFKIKKILSYQARGD